MTSRRLLIKTKNNINLKIEPCGTLALIKKKSTLSVQDSNSSNVYIILKQNKTYLQVSIYWLDRENTYP